MQPSPAQSARDEVTTAFRAYLQAMLDGDTDALDHLLAEGCTLTHITGYVQPKDEWLSQMRAGQFLYHGIEEKSVAVEVEGSTGRVSGRFVTDATVYGTRAHWRLHMAMDYAREGDTWSVIRSAATTW
ncbi:nuclear transport factor 2 family protein [Streptomyces sp. DSM 3412]|uniref:Nuclear transport factor 2 family protein n=1 Tax=Streptomyces gottesmaniae TaxID=3075518 RepID=A0ABU2YW14_9ACTN|nr:nuclear transport factor 2 family protein [Streptomyces sp. DSM 3412]MDT0568524.1 nuclear transport factor 2 family protein [Streptomyces sp. DSM 3412]